MGTLYPQQVRFRETHAHDLAFSNAYHNMIREANNMKRWISPGQRVVASLILDEQLEVSFYYNNCTGGQSHPRPEPTQATLHMGWCLSCNNACNRVTVVHYHCKVGGVCPAAMPAIVVLQLYCPLQVAACVSRRDCFSSFRASQVNE